MGEYNEPVTDERRESVQALEDFAYLSGQADEWDPIKALDIFIQRNVDTNHQAHLLDSDDNDGEYVRRSIRQALFDAWKDGAKAGKGVHRPQNPYGDYSEGDGE